MKNTQIDKSFQFILCIEDNACKSHYGEGIKYHSF